MNTIESIVSAARQVPPQIAERRLLKGTDGKWYSHGMPIGVKSTGEVSPSYYVRMSREGTTYGKRYDSREALQDAITADQSARDAEFRAELEKMNLEELQRQADYWLKL